MKLPPRRRLVPLLCLLALSLAAWRLREPLRARLAPAPMPAAALVGIAAPYLAPMRALDGAEVSLAALRGHVVLAHFWTFACSNCEHLLPRYNEWLDRYGARGLRVVGFHTPELPVERVESNLRTYAASHHLRWTVVPDSAYDAWNAFGVNAWPTLVLLDREGRVRGVFVGEHVAPQVEAALQRVL